MDEQAICKVIEGTLIRIAENVAKHCIQRSGWTAGDECFRVDLRQSEDELTTLVLELAAWKPKTASDG